MPSRVADRITQARQRLFVGRNSEQGLFLSALGADELPFQVLHIFGPGGIGKTTLLHEYARIAREHTLRVAAVDGRNIEPVPENFLNALRAALGLAAGASALQYLAENLQRQVILIDTYELLAPLDAWLYESFFLELPDNTLIVLASRNPPSNTARADAGWQTLIRSVSLRNLNPQESRKFLSNRHVPANQHQAVLNFTHGQPLALSLVADMFAQRQDWNFQAQAAPDVVKILLERFVQKVPGPAHRAALEACALVRVTTKSLLAEMLKLPDPAGDTAQGAHELFEWLRGLSFIEAGEQGIYPHDLAREALVADLHWRNPDWYKELHNRARIYYVAHLQSSSLQDQQRILFDYIFLHRDNPIMRAMFEWQASGIWADGLRAGERDILLEMIAAHEGASSAQLAAHWLDRQPEGVSVYRDERGNVIGIFFIVELQRATPAEIEADPATRAAWNYLKQRAPLRPGEVAAHYRFWMARDSYQAVSAVQTQIFLSTVRYQIATAGLAFHFLPCADPDFWSAALTYGDLTRLPETDYSIGERTYGVFAHDWRSRPPLAWLALLAEREVGETPSTANAEPLIVLSRNEFDAAVRDALLHFMQNDLLANNPLLRSRLVMDRVSAPGSQSERVDALKQALREVVESLNKIPRDAKLYRALYYFYLHPAGSQEQASEAADVPFSTFRRHLKAGLTRVVTGLWQKEIGAGGQ